MKTGAPLRSRLRLLLFTLALAWAAGATPWVRADGLAITEFLALNEGGLRDEDGDYADWIELFNDGADALSLEGWFLTDDPAHPAKWRFPQRPLLAGEYLVVFASGKDRQPATGPLHTNFRLAVEGGYLALVRPDGITRQSEFAPYPPQRAGVSFGTSQSETRTELLGEGSPARILVPGDGSLGLRWAGGSEPFDDSTWIVGKNGVGYVSWVPGFAVQNYKSNAMVNDLGAAEEVLQNPALQASLEVENADVVDYQGTSSPGHYPLDRPFPGTTAGQDVEDFVVLATGKVMIPAAGEWTFGVMSDDGFGLELRRGDRRFAMAYPAPRGPDDSLATFDLPEPGEYDLRLVFYERGGGSGLELFAGRGAIGAWNGRDFRLVGDTVGGGLEVRSQVATGSGGGSLLDFIQTDMRARMENLRPAAYLRIPFQVANPGMLSGVFLRVRSDDGFVAYLNGTEVARRNAPGEARFDSLALTNRWAAEAIAPESVNVTAFVGRLRAGSNLLAVHGLNDRIDSPDFLVSARLEDVAVTSSTSSYLERPTPGGLNAAGFQGFVEEVQFSATRGFYQQPLDLTLACATVGASIRYTTDGTAPTATTGDEYTGPVHVQRTTTLRAAAFRSGYRPSKVATHTYLFPEDIVRQDAAATLAAGFPATWNGVAPDYGLDRRVSGQDGTDAYGGKYARTMRDDLRAVPTVSLVVNLDDLFGPGGIYSNPTGRGDAWEKPVSVEFIDPAGQAGFQENAGLRIQGGAFRDFGLTKKKSFRLVFKEAYGATHLRSPLFGPDAADRFDNVILRANNNDGWQWDAAGGRPLYIRDAFAHASAREMGMVAAHSLFVHLYLNGIYWGLYNPVERPDAAFASTYLGGDRDAWDAINYDSAPDGNYDAWNRMLAIARSGLADNGNYQRIQGNNPDGARNPELEDLLDVDNLIDYMILNFYVGNRDWPHRNYWVGRNRSGGDGFKFFPWDTEWAIGLESDLNTDQTGVNGAVAEPYGAARANPEFRMRFADHVYRHFAPGGAFYVDPAHPNWDASHPERNRPAARLMALANRVDRAIVPESARWGDQHAATPYTRDEHWQVERDNLLRNYFPQRSAVVLAQFRQAGLYPSVDPPQFSQTGGPVEPGFQLALSAPRGTIFYTTDGSDPRAPVTVDEVSRITLVTSAAPKRVLVPSASNGGDKLGTGWQGGSEPFDDSRWTAGAGGVGYDRETTYRAYIQTDVRSAMDTKNGSAFIRIPFDCGAVQRERLNFLLLRVRYDDGFVAFLNGEVIASANPPANLAWNATASGQNADSAAVIYVEFKADDRLPALRVGPNVLAIQGLNVSTGSTDFLIDAELVVGERKVGGGSTSAQLYTRPLVLNDLTTVKTRVLDGSEWSALNEATFSVGTARLAVTELLYHPAPPTPVEQAAGFLQAEAFEFVELRNLGNGTCDLTGVRFIDGLEYDFTGSAVTRLAPGQFVLVVKNRAAFERRYGSGLPVAGEFVGQLSNNGERIELVDGTNRSLVTFTYATRAPWPAAADGTGASLELSDPLGEPNAATSWQASLNSGGSPGRPSLAGPLQIETAIVAEGALRFRFRGQAGWSYTVQVRASLSDGSWHDLRRIATLGADGPVELAEALSASPAARFFRVTAP